jgi:hypothetical protein
MSPFVDGTLRQKKKNCNHKEIKLLEIFTSSEFCYLSLATCRQNAQLTDAKWASRMGKNGKS